jgi:hypothetical protein
MFVYNTQNHWDFLTLSIVRYSKKLRTRRIVNWISFRLQVREETPTLLGPLERANLNGYVNV